MLKALHKKKLASTQEDGLAKEEQQLRTRIYLYLENKGHLFNDNDVCILERGRMVYERCQNCHLCSNGETFPQ